jgi:hypothetical protein
MRFQLNNQEVTEAIGEYLLKRGHIKEDGRLTVSAETWVGQVTGFNVEWHQTPAPVAPTEGP